MEDEVDSACVIHYVEPIAYVFTLAIDRQRFAVTDIIDKERNQFLGELIGAIVVRAVGDDSRHAVGVMESAYEVVGRRFGGRVW